MHPTIAHSFVYDFLFALLRQLKLDAPLLLVRGIFLMPVLKMFLFHVNYVVDVI